MAEGLQVGRGVGQRLFRVPVDQAAARGRTQAFCSAAAARWRAQFGACGRSASMVVPIIAASSFRPAPPSITTLRPSRSSAWMPCVPSWIMFRRLSRQYCSTGKSRV